MYRLGLAIFLTFFAVTLFARFPKTGALACGLKHDESQIVLIDKMWSQAAA